MFVAEFKERRPMVAGNASSVMFVDLSIDKGDAGVLLAASPSIVLGFTFLLGWMRDSGTRGSRLSLHAFW